MSDPSARKFNIVDMFVIVAATALGMVPLSTLVKYGQFFNSKKLSNPGIWTWADWLNAIEVLQIFSVAFLTSWTLALIPIRLRAPRPARRQLWCQPGLTACSTVAITIVAFSPHAFFAWKRWGPPLSYMLLYKIIYDVAAYGGFSVGAIWMILALGDLWCSEASWIDRSGRVIGSIWIMLSIYLSWIALFLK